MIRAVDASTNQLDLVDATGAGRVETIAAAAGMDSVHFRPPAGREILYRALVDGKWGLFAMDADGTNVRPLIEPTIDASVDMSFAQVAYSADGSRIFYNRGSSDGCCRLLGFWGSLHFALSVRRAASEAERITRGVRKTSSSVLSTFVREDRKSAPSNGMSPRIGTLVSSVGITKVTAAGGVAGALDLAFRYDATALVEKGITGRELECSVLGNESPEASLAGEVIPFREFYDYKDKYIDGRTRFAIPAELPARSMARVRALAVAAFKALAASGMARVDFFLEKGTNRLYINELNTIPGFTEISMYPKLWEVSGLPFPRLLERLIELGFERHRAGKACVSRDP